MALAKIYLDGKWLEPNLDKAIKFAQMASVYHSEDGAAAVMCALPWQPSDRISIQFYSFVLLLSDLSFSVSYHLIFFPFC